MIRMELPRSSGNGQPTPPSTEAPPPTSSNLDTTNLAFATQETLSPEERFHTLRKLSKEAVEATHTAMDSDERDQKTIACRQYNEACGMLDRAISYTKSWEFPEERKQAVGLNRINLEQNRDRILERMKELQAELGRPDSLSYLSGPAVNPLPDTSVTRVPPPYVNMYPELPRPGTIVSPLVQPRQSFGEQLAGGVGEEQAPVEANEVFSISQNIQIYFISPSDENVSAPSYPSFLRIIVINQDNQEVQDSVVSVASPSVPVKPPPAFLQVGDWTYPLIPGQSPVFKASFGSYIFPDLSAPGSSIGLVFPQEVSDAERMVFDEILLQLLGLQQFPSSEMFEKLQEPVAPARRRSQDAVIGSSRMDTTATATQLEPKEDEVVSPQTRSRAEAIAQGIVYGAQKTSGYISAGATYLMDRIHPVSTEPVIKPEVRKGVKTAKNITGKAVKVSGFLVTQVGRGTMLLGRTLAPYIQTTTARLVAKTTEKSDEEARKSVNTAFEVTGACLVSLGTIYVGLEESAKIMAQSIGNNTVRIIDKRYGQQAGYLAHDTAHAIGNAAYAGYNVHCLGPKSIAKRAVKDAGMQAVMHKDGSSSTAGAGSSPKNAITSPVSDDDSSSSSTSGRTAPPRPPPPRKHKK